MSAQISNRLEEVSKTTRRILIIARKDFFVDGIVHMLESSSDNNEVICVAPGAPCMSYFVGESPDFLFIQEKAKPEPFEDFVTEMVEGFPDMRLLVFGQSMSDEYLYRIICAGAHGYFNEKMSGEHMLQAVDTVSNGQYWVERHIMERFIDDCSFNDGIESRVKLMGNRLTNRETEVLELIMQGLSTSDIAEQIFLSHQGVKAHLTTLFRKFDVKNRSQLILRALDEASPVESLSQLFQQSLKACRVPEEQLVAG
jgi:DNA-binding NarL/FixJ family response regulator